MAKKGPGRPKGSRNKRTVEIQERLQSADPIGQILALAAETDDPEFRLKCLLGVLPYGYARLAASTIDLKGALMGDFTLNVNLSK